MRGPSGDGGYRGRVLRRSRAVPGLVAALAACLVLAGCSGGSSDPGAAPDPTSAGSQRSDPVDPGDPLLSGLDICSLVSEAQVRRAVGQVGEPTGRVLTTIDGYGGLVDQCGFGVG